MDVLGLPWVTVRTGFNVNGTVIFLEVTVPLFYIPVFMLRSHTANPLFGLP